MANEKITKTRVKVKADTAANWEQYGANFTPLEREPIFYTDTGEIKLGDGVTTVNELPKFNVGKKTAEGGEIFNDKLNKARAQYSHAEGNSTEAGSKAFSITNFNSTNKTITLDSVAGLAVGDVYFCPVGVDNGLTNFGTIEKIEGNTITVKAPSNSGEDNPKEPEVDDDARNIFYILNKPLAGTSVIGDSAHAEGYNTQSTGYASHSEGIETLALENGAHAEGKGTYATGPRAHAEGEGSSASAICAHAEGAYTEATKEAAHAEGKWTKATGDYSHAEGKETLASGTGAHSEGMLTEATGGRAHAEGEGTKATALCAHAEGGYTIANAQCQHVEGKFNVPDEVDTSGNGNYVHITGWGTSDKDRKNIYTLDTKGNGIFAGNVFDPDGILTAENRVIELMGGDAISGKTVHVFGDSLFYGHNKQSGMLSEFATKYNLTLNDHSRGGMCVVGIPNNNYGSIKFETVSDPNLANKAEPAEEDKTKKLRYQILNAPDDANADFVIFDGLVNDAWSYDAELNNGKTTRCTVGNVYSSYLQEHYNTETYCGELEWCVAELYKKYPNAIKIFVTPHRMKTRSGSGLYQLTAAVRKVVNKWNGHDGQTLLLADIYENNPSIPTAYWIKEGASTQYDYGTHLTPAGYNAYYIPTIHIQMMAGLNKTFKALENRITELEQQLANQPTVDQIVAAVIAALPSAENSSF